MKKAIKHIFFHLTLLVLCLAPSVVLASDYIYRDTGNAKTFYVHSYGTGASIDLWSNEGIANVHTHIFSVFDSGYKNVNHHGFYLVTVSGSNTYKSYSWVPSAAKWILDTTHNREYIDTTKLTIYFNTDGNYTITVKPYSPSQASQYWKIDTLGKNIFWCDPNGLLSGWRRK